MLCFSVCFWCCILVVTSIFLVIFSWEKKVMMAPLRVDAQVAIWGVLGLLIFFTTSSRYFYLGTGWVCHWREFMYSVSWQ